MIQTAQKKVKRTKTKPLRFYRTLGIKVDKPIIELLKADVRASRRRDRDSDLTYSTIVRRALNQYYRRSPLAADADADEPQD